MDNYTRRTLVGIIANSTDIIISVLIAMTLLNNINWARIGKFNKQELKREQAELYMKISVQKDAKTDGGSI